MVSVQLSLLDHLRARTGAAHAALDAALTSEGGLPQNRYAAFLRASLAVLETLEPAVARWFDDVADPPRRDALRADLAALCDTRAIELAAVDAPETLAEAAGCAYVIEGSTLGGVALAERLEHDHPGLPAAYLRLRGRDTGRRWRQFIDELARRSTTFDDAQRDVACHAAEQLFRVYAASFRAHGAAS